MRILVDTAHPANVHYFKNFIFVMKQKGHKVHITARDKDISFSLLEALNLPYYNMGTGSLGKGTLGKILYVIYADFLMFIQFIKFRPDIVISFSSSYTAHNCFLFRIPHITFEDTEHATMNMLLYKPFSDMIITPNSFYKDMGKNHFKMDAYMELFYLHPQVFKPSREIVENASIDINKPFTLFRFVSWGAFHDIGQKGLTVDEKILLVEKASKYGNVYISSEGELPESLKKYQVKVAPIDIHHVLYFANLYVGEGGTMASECAMLGTPSIYVNSLPLMGYLKDAQRAGLLYHLDNYDKILSKIDFLFQQPKSHFKSLSKDFLSDRIEPTSFLVWLVEEYPESKNKLRKDSTYQNIFKTKS